MKSNKIKNGYEGRHGEDEKDSYKFPTDKTHLEHIKKDYISFLDLYYEESDSTLKTKFTLYGGLSHWIRRYREICNEYISKGRNITKGNRSYVALYSDDAYNVYRVIKEELGKMIKEMDKSELKNQIEYKERAYNNNNNNRYDLRKKNIRVYKNDTCFDPNDGKEDKDYKYNPNEECKEDHIISINGSEDENSENDENMDNENNENNGFVFDFESSDDECV